MKTLKNIITSPIQCTDLSVEDRVRSADAERRPPREFAEPLGEIVAIPARERDLAADNPDEHAKSVPLRLVHPPPARGGRPRRRGEHRRGGRGGAPPPPPRRGGAPPKAWRAWASGARRARSLRPSSGAASSWDLRRAERER